MKTSKIYLAFVLGLGLVLASCECKKCTKENENSVDVCRNNYDSQSDYEDAVTGYQLMGYGCNP